LHQLAYRLEIFTAEIVAVKDVLFVNHLAHSRDELLAEIATHGSLSEAQRWMNIVLLDDFISEVVGDEWADDDPAVGRILSTISQAWSYQIRAVFPTIQYSIERVSDPEYGDLGLRLLNSPTA
jgi:hypothetical protein